MSAVYQVPQILIEDGVAERLGDISHSLAPAGACALITDKTLMQLSLPHSAIKSLQEAGYAVSVFEDVSPDPKVEELQKAAALCRSVSADLVIGLGGGSVMDVAKLAAYMALNDDAFEDMAGVNRLGSKRLPLIQVPTTAGTGSEVTNVSVMTTGETTKMGVVDPVLFADIAVLDAALTLSLPRHVTAATGIDAMVHAIEAYTSKRLKNPVSDALSKQALCLLGTALVRACEAGDDISARRDMLVGAMMAGQSFANAPVAAVHALAYPLGGHFHIPHGHSNSLVLPYVLGFNMDAARDLYGELGQAVGARGDNRSAQAGAFADWLDGLVAETGIERRLRDVGIPQNSLDLLAREAMKQERLLINNPVTLTEDDARALYEAAW